MLVAILSIFSVTNLYMYNMHMHTNTIAEKKVYDKTNVFARILRNELPCKKAHYNGVVFENQHAVAIYDINPRKNVHILLLPKGEYVDLRDFLEHASNEEKIAAYNMLVSILNHCVDVRVENNLDIYQEVPHLHWHIMADRWI